MSRVGFKTVIRPTTPSDDASISTLLPPSSQEAKTLASLRKSETLSLSLVTTAAESGIDGQLIAILACSPISLSLAQPTSTSHTASQGTHLIPTPGWFALGPVYVSKPYRRKGIGTELILNGLETLEREHGGKGVVVVGFPSFYRRLGFVHEERITFDGAPEQYFMVKRLAGGEQEEGLVRDFGAFQ